MRAGGERRMKCDRYDKCTKTDCGMCDVENFEKQKLVNISQELVKDLVKEKADNVT